MTLEELIKLKQENYPLFVETVKGLNEEIPEYLKISKSNINRILSVLSPEHKFANSKSLTGKSRGDDFKKKMSKIKTKPFAKYKDKIYTRQELAEELNVHVNTITWIKTGQLKNKYEIEFL
jgi:hypothetical protein